MTRLTEEMVVARTKQSDLASIKKLNCWGSELSNVSLINKMSGVEILALSVNQVSTLADFQNCHKLQELYLRKNNIEDLNELTYLQGLPRLKNLWLEENPCVDKAGPNYRSMVLRALPNLRKLDNIDVTEEELADALSGASLKHHPGEEVSYENSCNNDSRTQYQHQQQEQPSAWRNSSPTRDQPHHSPENTEGSLSDPIDQNSIPSSPLQRTPPNPEYSTNESAHPTSPKYNRDHRHSYHQSSYDRSPGSEHDNVVPSQRERTPITQSMSTHSMKDYYQSERPTPIHYRHSQTDLSEWDENNYNDLNRNHQSNHPTHNMGQPQQPRRSGPIKRETSSAYGTYPYRNGSKEKDDWEEPERSRQDGRRSDGRFSETGSVVSSAVLNHYASLHRRPVNRSSNLLSATLCLVKELDYPSLEVVEHAVRCRIDELANE